MIFFSFSIDKFLSYSFNWSIAWVACNYVLLLEFIDHYDLLYWKCIPHRVTSHFRMKWVLLINPTWMNVGCPLYLYITSVLPSQVNKLCLNSALMLQSGHQQVIKNTISHYKCFLSSHVSFFFQVCPWGWELTHCIVLFIVINRQVSIEEGEGKAQELGVMFIKTSAKAGFNIKVAIIPWQEPIMLQNHFMFMLFKLPMHICLITAETDKYLYCQHLL